MGKNTNTAPVEVNTKGIHKQLQEIAAAEIARIPELLEQVTPAERIRFILAILPYTAPKVETCATHFGEGFTGWD